MYIITSRILQISFCSLILAFISRFGLPLGAAINGSIFPKKPLAEHIYGYFQPTIIVIVLVVCFDCYRLINVGNINRTVLTYVSSPWLNSIAIITLSLPFSYIMLGNDSGILFPIWAGCIFGIRGSRQKIEEDIFSAGLLDWHFQGAIRALKIGIILVVFCVVFGLLKEATAWQGFIYGFVYASAAFVVSFIWGGLLARPPREAETRASGTRFWTRTGIFAGVTFGVSTALCVFLVGLLTGKIVAPLNTYISYWLMVGLSKGCIVFVVAFFIYGGLDMVQYLCLRASLWISNLLPLRLKKYINLGRELGLIIKVGSSYEFVHRDLQDYLCDLTNEEGSTRL